MTNPREILGGADEVDHALASLGQISHEPVALSLEGLVHHPQEEIGIQLLLAASWLPGHDL